jgi:3-oxoacyl-(acyl-carrier-protein) synthase
MTQVAITGWGTITPAGIGLDPLWAQVMAGKSCAHRIDRFDPAPFRCQVAGQADSFNPQDWLPLRTIMKTDRFTHLAMAAAAAALRDAGLRIGCDADVAPERIGIMVGNVLGGWEFAERELRNLWVHGVRGVSPYQATAWFPAAPQGNICIANNIKGRSRTFVCDRASGAYALIHAAETIRRGQADVVLAGGTEQPLSPYAWLCSETANYLTPYGNSRPEEAYRPFDRRHGGSVIGEGSTFLILENLDHAKARGAAIRALLSGWAVSTDGYMPYYSCEPYGQTLAAAMLASLHEAGIGPSDLGCVIADGSAVPREDSSEVAALTAVLGRSAHDVPVTAAKSAVSHLLGAATPTDVLVAIGVLKHGQLPPIANLDSPAPGFDLDFVMSAPREAQVGHVLVVSRGLGGVNACLTLTS